MNAILLLHAVDIIMTHLVVMLWHTAPRPSRVEPVPSRLLPGRPLRSRSRHCRQLAAKAIAEAEMNKAPASVECQPQYRDRGRKRGVTEGSCSTFQHDADWFHRHPRKAIVAQTAWVPGAGCPAKVNLPGRRRAAGVRLCIADGPAGADGVCNSAAYAG